MQSFGSKKVNSRDNRGYSSSSVVSLGVRNTDAKDFRVLKNWHIAAAVVHGLSFVGILVAFLITGGFFGDEERTARHDWTHLFSDVLRFDKLQNSANLTTSVCQIQASEESHVYFRKLNISGYNPLQVLLFMPLVTLTFHLVQAALCAQDYPKASQYLRQLKRGVNWVRWFEYSISATLMTWLVAQAIGVSNFHVVFLVAVIGNVSLQMNGYLHERMFASFVESKGSSGRPCQDRSKWVPMGNGFVIFVGQWLVMVCYLVRTVNISNGSIAMYTVNFVTFALFPLVQFLFTCRVFTNWRNYEIAFIVISMVSKLSLDLLYVSLAV